jgi:ubiquinone biosynthesis protein UbiJ
MSLTTEIILSLTEALETSINLVLKQDPATLQKFGAMQGKVIAFELSELDITLYLFPHTEGVQVQYLYQGIVDTTLQGSPLAFINMSLGDSTESFFSGEIRFKGDIELGQQFKRLLDQLNLDWEEWLSGYTGDLVAFKTGELIRNLSAWGKDSLKILQLDAQEYFQDEGQLSPHPVELDDFTNKVSQLRDHTARLEAQVLRLQKQLNKDSKSLPTN